MRAQHIFEIEQASYASEGIPWSRIAYPDNHECIELITKSGILSILDDECRLQVRAPCISTYICINAHIHTSKQPMRRFL